MEDNLSDYHTAWDLGLAPFSFEHQCSKTASLKKKNPNTKKEKELISINSRTKNEQKRKEEKKITWLNIKKNVVQDFTRETENYSFTKTLITGKVLLKSFMR